MKQLLKRTSDLLELLQLLAGLPFGSVVCLPCQADQVEYMIAGVETVVAQNFGRGIFLICFDHTKAELRISRK